MSGIQSESDRSPSDSNRPPLKLQTKDRSEGGRRAEGGDGGEGMAGRGARQGRKGKQGRRGRERREARGGMGGRGEGNASGE